MRTSIDCKTFLCYNNQCKIEKIKNENINKPNN